MGGHRDHSLAGQVVLITGASSGIGRALALEFAGRGATVVGVARRGELLAEVQREVAAARLPGRVEPQVADLADPDAAAGAVAAALARHGRLDVVVANAGVGEQGLAHLLPRDRVDATVRVNLLAAIRTLEAALPSQLARGSGRLAAIASLAGLAPMPTAAVYGATKAGLVSYCRALGAEVRPRGVTVTCVCPGFVRTPMIRANRHAVLVWEPEQAARVIADGILRGRRAVVFPRRLALAVRLTALLPGVMFDAVWRRLVPWQRLERAAAASREHPSAGVSSPPR